MRQFIILVSLHQHIVVTYNVFSNSLQNILCLDIHNCFLHTIDPVAVFNNDRELEPDAVINVFSQYEGLDHLSLGCVGTVGNGELQWEAREVARFSGVIDESVLSTNDDISIGYYSSDRRDSLLTLRPVTQSTVGYYTCRSTVSDYVATVLTTYQNPYFAFTSLTYYEVPLGVRVDISARYAYWSNGRMNIGTGFRYNLTFLPYLELSMSASNTTSMPPLLQEQLLDVGFTDASSNNYIYTIYAGENSGGQYNLTCKHKHRIRVCISALLVCFCSSIYTDTGSVQTNYRDHRDQ